MSKPLRRSLFTALTLLSLFAASSALAAHQSRRERSFAAHRHPTHHRHTGHRSRQWPGVHNVETAATPMLLGDQAIESNRDNLIAGQAEAFPFQTGMAGPTGAVHVYIDSRNTASTLLVGLYTNLNGHPGSLLTTGSLSSPLASAWNTAPVASAQLVSGTTYWLAVLGTGGTLRYRDRWHGPCKAETSAQTNLGALSTLWRTGRVYSTCPISAYVSAAALTLPVGPPAPVEPVEPTPPPSPPPAVPTNTTPPTIAGTTTEGQQLIASSGKWTASPTSYAYQWQDCNTAGSSCLNVNGATTSTFTLSSSDVGHTIRVIVTASNASGSNPASSAPTATVAVDTPPPPTASFTYAPTSPVAGQALTLDGSNSTCSDGPCTYEWSDDGGETRPIPPQWPLGNGQTLKFTFSNPGTKYVRLVVTDATGQTATVERNIVVGTSSLSTAPSNTEMPSVNGSAEVGQTLAATPGTWRGTAPISFAYQWQHCSASGESCASIVGATSTNLTVAEADAGQTLRVVVTANNSAGSTPANSAVTAIVVLAAAVPSNIALPAISGEAIEGETLSANAGTWTGSPTSYAYQWQDCNNSGANCSNISGAKSVNYTLVESDVGSTVRVIVTASNASGSMNATSEPSETIAGGEAFTCSKEVHPTEETTKIARAIAEATAGETICFASGTYPKFEMVGGKGEVKGKKEGETENGRTGYVTVRPANGAIVTLEGFTDRDSNYERFEHFTFTKGVLFYDELAYSGSSHYQLLYDTFEEPSFGVDVRGPESGGGLIKDVTLEHDYMRKVTLESYGKEGKTGECKAGVATGQDVTVSNAEGIVIKHDTFYEAQWHYIQGGSNGPEGMRVENNLFSGMDPYECTHLNVWQIFGGGENDYFKNNIVIGRGTGHNAGPFKNGTELAATDILEFENGVASGECGVKIKNTSIENNLFVDAGGNSQLWTMEGATTNDNTIVNLESYFATGLGTVAERHCGPSTTLTVTHNIAATAGPLTMGEVTGSGTFDYNVTTGASANANGSTHFVSGWEQKWETTTWPVFEELEDGVHFPKPPAGYYIPEGLPFEAGYQGGAGP